MGSWREDGRVDCTRKHFDLLERLRPRAWVWESVTQAFTDGREFVEELTLRALELGYAVTYLLHDTCYLGVPQSRKRFFFIAHQMDLDFEVNFDQITTCGQALRRLNYIGESDYNLSPHLMKLIPKLIPGRTLQALWDELNPNAVQNERGQFKGRPAFAIRRLKAEQPSSGTVGYIMIHPTEDRCLTTREIAALAGFPGSYEFIGSGKAQQIARGVCPPVGAWLGQAIRAGLARDKFSGPRVQLHDLRRPPGCIQNLDSREIEMRQPAPAPTSGQGSGAYIRQLLTLERWTPTEIIELVHQHYPTSRATTKDVSWNKRKLMDLSTPKSALSIPKLAPTTQQLTESQRKQSLPTHVDPNREFDTTSLKTTSHGYRVHRDYGAHFFRWGWVTRQLKRDLEVLDVGCGVDTPFIRVLSGPEATVALPKRYVGVDLNPLKNPPNRPWVTYLGEFNFIKRYRELGTFDRVICLEVIEHMRITEGRKLLRAMRACLKPSGLLYLSTPVFNGNAAANHLHEYTISELSREVKRAGFLIQQRFGTFANKSEIKKVALPEELVLLKQLRTYYGDDVLACFLAPLYPDASRNNLWVLEAVS